MRKSPAVPSPSFGCICLSVLSFLHIPEVRHVPFRLPAGVLQRRSPQLVGLTRYCLAMYFYTLGPFLFVSHFAGYLITRLPLPCPSLDIPKLTSLPILVLKTSPIGVDLTSTGKFFHFSTVLTANLLLSV
jgi:hypothetical protein